MGDALGLGEALFAALQRLLRPLALDALGDKARHRGQLLVRALREGLAGEHRHGPNQPAFDDEGMTGEGHHPLPLGPFLFVDAGIGGDVVGQVGPTLLCDQADVQLSDGHAGVPAVQAGIRPRAGPELQHLLPFVERPDAGELRAQVLDHGLGAPLQDARQGPVLREGGVYVRAQLGLARQPGPHLLGPLALGDVHHGADHPDRLSSRVAHHVRPVHDGRVRPVGAPETVLLRPGLAVTLEDGVDARLHPLSVVGVDALLPPGVVGYLPRGVAEHLLQRPVPHLRVGGEVRVPDDVVRRPRDQPESLLALA